MKDESELFQWVENLANEGTWQSEGRFTLDRDKAWTKLSDYQLPFAEAWLLKLVQAAVLSVTRELKVKQTGSESTFIFIGQDRWNEEKVTQALFATDSVIDQGLVPLASAVRHLAKRADKLLALHYPDGTTQVWDGASFHTESSPRRVDSFQLTVFTAQRSGLKWAFIPDLGANESVKLKRVLSSLCYASPIPLSVNGRRLNGFSRDPHGGATATTTPFGVLPLKPDAHLPEFRFLRDNDWKPGSQEIAIKIAGEVESLGGDPLTCGSLAFFTACTREIPNPPRFARQPNYIKWIRDGVVVRAEKMAAKSSIGVTILVSAEGIRTDLSGLALAEDYNYHVRKKKVRNRVQAELRQLAKTDISGTVDVSFRGVAHKAAILGFAGLGIVNPWFLGLSGLAAAQYGSDWLRLRRRQFQLIEDFREFCREF